MSFVITEPDLFKYIISENEEIGNAGSLENSRKFISRIPLNIFENEYFIIYEMARVLVDMKAPITNGILHQVILNHRDIIVSSPKVDLFLDIPDEGLRFENIVRQTMIEYNDLVDAEVDILEYLPNMELYLSAWAEMKTKELLHISLIITEEGYKVGNKTLKGHEDADYYYQRVMANIKAIINGNDDLLSDNIDTDTQSAEEVQEQNDQSEEAQEQLGFTGLPTLDKQMGGLCKGEMITIMAGSGVGKSRTAMFISKNIINNGHKTLVISLEQKSNRIFGMFQARHVLDMTGRKDITDKAIIRNTLAPEDRAVAQEALIDVVDNPNIGGLHIEGRNLKAVDVPLLLEQIWEDFQFDAVVIDYLGLLEIESDRYTEITDCVNWLKSACKSFKGQGFFLVIPHQLSNEATKELMSGRSDLASVGGSESAYVYRGSDVVLMLNRDAELMRDKKMEIFVPKIRLGENIEKITVSENLGQCKLEEIASDEETSEFFNV